jgi:hypothetical protein
LFNFSIGVVVDPTEILSGLFKYFSANLKTYLGKVAENNNVCVFLELFLKLDLFEV